MADDQKNDSGIKDRSKDEKTVIAGSVAGTVMLVLFIGWGVLFLRKLHNPTQLTDLSAGTQDQFVGSNVTDAQKNLQTIYSSSTDEYRTIREEAATRNSNQVYTPAPSPGQSGGTDQFGTQEQGSY